MNVLELGISIIAPHRCFVCGQTGQIICEACAISNLTSPPPRCYRCHAVTKQSQVCAACRQVAPLKHLWVASDFQDISKELVHRMKYERVSSTAEIIAKMIDQVLPDLPPKTVVCHIPTANSRVRTRGYDQARLIAKELAKIRGWQHETLLLRKGATRQVGAKRHDRFKQLENVFQPIRHNHIKNAHILLIDDVTTTGATVESAAKTLRKAGAKTIDTAVFAQA